ncbi:hypothetical protein UFOVP253_47 [uncultured Caudovirales phage]|uniref:Uncharacterized protein n=1 Tax=uncultured Caudovirales phage TaxID=2100421 RepID=A0A6J5LDB7_9CAUD|nr:hypothetical protein UFOVP253_47 [uncultured Caudovirales phage]
MPILPYGSPSASNRVLKSGDTMTGTLNSQNVIAKTNATYTLGDSSHYYTNSYVTRLNVNASSYLDGASAGVATLASNAGDGIFLLDNISGSGCSVFNAFAPNIPNNQPAKFRIGVAASNFNSAEFNFNYVSAGSSSNNFSFGLYGFASIMSFTSTTITANSNLNVVGALTGRINKRIGAVASSATPTINTDTVDEFDVTALATAITSMTTNLSGTPVNGQELMLRFKDNGTPQTITWGTSFVSSGVATLLATTVASKTHFVLVRYDSTAIKWVCMAVDAVGY